MHPSFDFTTLPADLLRPLLLGFSGKLHLHRLAGIALGHGKGAGDPLARVAGDALLAAWGENPLDANCSAAMAGSMDRTGPVPAALLPVIKGMLAHWTPEVTPEAERALAGEPKDQLAFLRDRLHHAPRNLFWWHHLYEYCRITGHWTAFTEALTGFAPPAELAGPFGLASANALLASGDPAAVDVYRQLAGTLPLPVVEERLASALLRAGRRDHGRDLLSRCAQARPWNVGLWLRLHELAVDGDRALSPPQGRVMVLAYSWNKADDLAATLDSLLASDLDDVRVRVLDNGSTDHTAEVIHRFADRFGTDRAKSVTMPVNVGAPAARNWLMALPETRASDFTAFIDDDISLPPDWLNRLGAATLRYPDAGVWGCKVVGYDGPARVQCGEHNLTPDPAERGETLMSTVMLQDADFGQADYIRPCASVTGCVHLFRTNRLLENGPFDLRFSPTQYDDLERDLRMVLAGGYAVYTGFLAIPHKRRSGVLSGPGGTQSANATANMHKLQAKYDEVEFEAMARGMDGVLLADLLAKLKSVA